MKEVFVGSGYGFPQDRFVNVAAVDIAVGGGRGSGTAGVVGNGLLAGLKIDDCAAGFGA